MRTWPCGTHCLEDAHRPYEAAQAREEGEVPGASAELSNRFIIYDSGCRLLALGWTVVKCLLWCLAPVPMVSFSFRCVLMWLCMESLDSCLSQTCVHSPCSPSAPACAASGGFSTTSEFRRLWCLSKDCGLCHYLDLCTIVCLVDSKLLLSVFSHLNASEEISHSSQLTAKNAAIAAHLERWPTVAWWMIVCNGCVNPACCHNGHVNPACCHNGHVNPTCCHNGHVNPACCCSGCVNPACCLWQPCKYGLHGQTPI